VDIRVRSQGSACWTCGGDSGTVTDFFPTTSVDPVSVTPPTHYTTEGRVVGCDFMALSENFATSQGTTIHVVRI